MKIFNFIQFLLVSFLFISCTDLKETSVPVQSHSINTYSFIKNTKYLVVFESGLGDEHSVWTKKNIIREISPISDILTYDRAGLGKSEPGPDPRNISTLTSELESVVNLFANGRKVILVGHSLGGLIVRDYAIKNPEKTAAILFVDPAHELYNHFSESAIDTICNSMTGSFGNDFAGISEARSLIDDLQYSSNLPDLPDVPVVVLTSMIQNAANINADKMNKSSRQGCYNAHESLKNGVTDFTHISTTQSGHYIMIEEPGLIIDNIKTLISKLK
jgi:hypothetical protein